MAYFLTEITQILGYLQFWIRYLSEIFWRHSWDVGTLVQNNSEFFVCLSVPRKVFKVKVGGSVVVEKIEPKKDDSEKNKADKPETSTPIRNPEMGGEDDPTQEK